MGIITKYLSSSRTIQLASPSSAGSPKSFNAGVKSTDRVNRLLLENDYRFDAVSHNIINKQLQLIMHSGFRIKARTSKNQNFYDEFFEEIGTIGEEVTKEELVEYIFQDLLMYGNSFVELIYDAKTDSRVVDLKTIPEKTMDYAKNSMGEIGVDELGKPIGYVMTLPFGISAEGRGDEVPKKHESKVSISRNEIFFLPKRIAHFKLHTYGHRFYGIGLIEPAHLSTERKMRIEEANTNYIYTRGTNTLVANVGNERHESSEEDLQKVLDQLVNFKHDRYFAFPDWVQVKTLDSKPSDLVDQTLDYLRTNQAASSGMPLAFATGAGEATNRATLNNQQQILELSLEHIIKKFKASFDKFILRRIAETHGKGRADIEFGDLRSEEKNEKSDRLLRIGNLIVNSVDKGILAPQEGKLVIDELYKYFKTSEDLNEEVFNG